MPRRQQCDENANVLPTQAQLSRGSGLGQSRKPLGPRSTVANIDNRNIKTLSTQKERVFAKEIKNLVRKTCEDAFAQPTLYHDVVLDSGMFRALVKEFETLKLHPADSMIDAPLSLHAHAQAAPQESLNMPSPVSTGFAFSGSAALLFDNVKGMAAVECFSSQLNSTAPDLNPLIAQSLQPRLTRMEDSTRTILSCPGFSCPSSDRVLSFGSSSVTSQSTPLKFGKRFSRPHISKAASQPFAKIYQPTGLPSSSSSLQSGTQTSNTTSQLLDGLAADDALSQLATQLSQLVLSPCLRPVTDDSFLASLDSDDFSLDDPLGHPSDSRASEIEMDEDMTISFSNRINRSSLAPKTRNVRAKSISFGYISSAFTEVLGDSDFIFNA